MSEEKLNDLIKEVKEEYQKGLKEGKWLEYPPKQDSKIPEPNYTWCVGICPTCEDIKNCQNPKAKAYRKEPIIKLDDSIHILVQCPKCKYKYQINKEDLL